ncbi:acyl carrier protein [Micromonospora sp. DH15]|nr:acyl carrier protein [Micromonospora sp. DH15]
MGGRHRAAPARGRRGARPARRSPRRAVGRHGGGRAGRVPGRCRLRSGGPFGPGPPPRCHVRRRRCRGGGDVGRHPEPPAPPGDRDLTAQISAAWAEVLQISQVPTDVNFFDLGGHSMAMFRLQDALEQHTGIRPSVVALFRHTTIAAQAEMVFRPGRAVPAGTRHAAVHTRGRLARSRPARTEQETTP